jgi:undecaprenyl-diphosphatase
MITTLQALLLGLLQGATELFPLSSLGVTLVVPALLGWSDVVALQADTHGGAYLAFIVALHVGTALALVLYFRKEWVRLVTAFIRSLLGRTVDRAAARLAWLLVIATIPAGLAGLIFEKALRNLFARPTDAAVLLIVNGVILMAGDRVMTRKRPASHRMAPARRRDLDRMSAADGGIVGASQILALLAGISRSGVTMVTGLMRGLGYEDAAHFSFLMATPIILAAGLDKVPTLLSSRHLGSMGYLALIGGLAAGVTAWLSVRFLMRYFETRRLWPFGVVSIAVGVVALVGLG